MKVRLLYENRGFDPDQELPWHKEVLARDLELNRLLEAMSRGDRFVEDVARTVLLTGSENDPATMHYRQEIVKDCLANPDVVREIYNLAVDTLKARKKHHLGIFTYYPSSVLSSAVGLMGLLIEMAGKLKNFADKHGHRFESRGISNLFALLKNELADDYFTEVQQHVKNLKLDNGLIISAELGRGNVGNNYTLCKPAADKFDWMKRLIGRKDPAYTFQIHPRDQGGHQALAELRNRGVNTAANALARSAEHILDFFFTLKKELAFYIGCINLYERLSNLKAPVAFPFPKPVGENVLSFRELYDVCLALTVDEKVVGNSVSGDGKSLVLITGANQGGKTTFLRSLGLAQLMMESGMYVPAVSYSSNVSSGIFTHFRREEDAEMESGKWDEELGRMSDIVDSIEPGAIVLLNESFASTNEREGSEIARQVVTAMLESGIRVFYVTHLYEMANKFYLTNPAGVLFLRAERKEDGSRTFKMIEGRPLQTSFGEDLYYKFFGRQKI